MERVPQDDLDKLPGDVIVFAPATHNLGEVFPLSLGLEKDEQRTGVLIDLDDPRTFDQALTLKVPGCSVRPESMPSAEITSYKPTSRD
jgi:hypothetical protein